MFIDTKKANIDSMKANVKTARIYDSPTSIASYLSPPTMMKLPEPFVPELAMPAPANYLPPTSTWGLRHKVELRRRNRFAKLDDIDSRRGEELINKWRLPNKVHNSLEKKAEAHDKVKERNLLKKHYKKYRAAKAKARAEHEAHLDKASREETSEADAGANDVQRQPKSRRSLQSEKYRRNLRRDARDRKCFEPDDHCEAEAIGRPSVLKSNSCKLDHHDR